MNMKPVQLPLNYPTLRHVLSGCKNATTRRACAQGQIEKISAAYKWGLFGRHTGLAYLDDLNVAIRGL